MKFKFNAKKAAQAAFQLLSFAGGKLNYMVLVKLLYLSDRAALLELECPITGDRLLSLPYGPILGHVLSLIKTGPTEAKDAPWFETVSPPSGYDVTALNDPGDDELSNEEEFIIRRVFEKFGTMDWKALSKYTHALPEWTNPDGRALPIAPEQILKLEGRSLEEIREISDAHLLMRRLDEEVQAYCDEEVLA